MHPASPGNGVRQRVPRGEEAIISSHLIIWAVCALAIAGVLFRPFGISEWIWAAGGAVVLVAARQLSPGLALGAVGKGLDVYLFLSGMMVLAELARREGVFDWVAGVAVAGARGSRFALFAIVYGVGIVVTVVLSNDATAVVLTPAVAAAVKRAKADPLPYLYACALIANAASFVLPISNPANLVVFANDMPPLGKWLVAFGLPSLASIAITFAVLALLSKKELSGELAPAGDVPALSRGGRLTLGGIGATAVALFVASALGAQLGAVTLAAAAVVFVAVGTIDRDALGPVLTSVSWTVLLLVAGLFVLVEAMDTTGLMTVVAAGMKALTALPLVASVLAGAGSVALASNAVNNLPSGLIAGKAVLSLHGHEAFRNAVAIGIDLGPNLSVTGSLATVLWLIALRRERIEIGAWNFLRTGICVMPPALAAAVLAVLVTTRH